MIAEEEEWIQENFVYIQKFSSEHISFNLFQDYCSEIISKNPGLFFKSNDITMIEKSMLITMLERDRIKRNRYLGYCHSMGKKSKRKIK